MRTAFIAVFSFNALALATLAQNPPGEEPAIGHRMTQGEVTGGTLTVDELREHGLLMFATPFNKLDGYGDGPAGAERAGQSLPLERERPEDRSRGAPHPRLYGDKRPRGPGGGGNSTFMTRPRARICALEGKQSRELSTVSP